MTNLNKNTETTKRAVKVVRRTRHYLVFDAITGQVIKNIAIRSKSGYGICMKRFIKKNGLVLVDYGRQINGSLKNIKWGLKNPWGLTKRALPQVE